MSKLPVWNQNAKDSQWCPGCGDFGELAVLKESLAILDLEPYQTVIVGGIGCAGQMPQYLNGYAIKVPHGRVLPACLGIKLARPDLTVVGQGGDGDAFAIGGGHYINFPGWNVDITYMVTNNEVYGLTKGQLSPTASKDLKTKVNPDGGVKNPVHPIALALGSGWTFVARAATVGGTKSGLNTRVQSQEILKAAIAHKGSSLVIFETECPTYNKKKTTEWIRERAVDITTLADYDPTDLKSALMTSLIPDEEAIPLGIYYQTTLPTLHEKLGLTEPPLPNEIDVQKIERIMDKYA